MLTVHDLEVGYGGPPVLQGFSAELREGAVHGIVGRNGAGKTTFLDALFGFVKPSAGSVLFDGEPLTSARIGYLPADNFFYSLITGREYLAVVGGAASPESTDAWASLFDVPLDSLIARYSTGMRKELALLGVVALDRPLMLLDEPMNGLDLQSNLLLGRLLRELADRGTTVLLTSHVLESLTSVCDAIHLLAAGRLERSFPKEEFPGIRERVVDVEEEARVQAMRALLDAGSGD